MPFLCESQFHARASRGAKAFGRSGGSMSAWRHRLAPAANQEARKDPKWRKRVGFDNIMTPEDLELEQPVQERA